MVTKERLDRALEAWAVAREKALLEQESWAALLGSHRVLIATLKAQGHTWQGAEAEFQRLSSSHESALRSAWNAMDACCGDYQMLLAEYKSQENQA